MSTTVSIFPGAPAASLNTTGPTPLVIVELSGYPATAVVHIQAIAEADACLAAFTDAKRLITEATP